ncbi:hypothetical protein [Bacillus cereus]|uniref:hypothetical protein n=1 Tax=Bacillus cereus TaxID=1396 RepID=UPI003D6BA6F4
MTTEQFKNILCQYSTQSIVGVRITATLFKNITCYYSTVYGAPAKQFAKRI